MFGRRVESDRTDKGEYVLFIPKAAPPHDCTPPDESNWQGHSRPGRGSLWECGECRTIWCRSDDDWFQTAVQRHEVI